LGYSWAEKIIVSTALPFSTSRIDNISFA